MTATAAPVIPLSAATPPVRVIVITHGSGWLVTAVAVLGLVLALASLAWQVVMFTRSGSRVRVESRLALFPEVARGAPVLFDQEQAEKLDPSVRRDLVPTAVIRNTGRLPVSVECAWASDHASTEVTDWPAGDLPGGRLEAHAKCYAIPAPEQLAMLAGVARACGPPGASWWELWPVVELGNRKTRTGRPLRIPFADGDDREAR